MGQASARCGAGAGKRAVMRVIGLIGQVCAGKSAVALAFHRHGATVFDADRLVHEIYTRPETIAQMKQLFGGRVLAADGGVDRQALARVVFADPAQLKRLTEQVIFPRTAAALRQALTNARATGAPALVLDAPTLFEAGHGRDCQHVVFVSAPRERRSAWARQRGWDETEIERREAHLGDEQIRRQRADALIDNSGSLADLDGRVAELFHIWGITQKKAGLCRRRPVRRAAGQEPGKPVARRERETKQGATERFNVN